MCFPLPKNSLLPHRPDVAFFYAAILIFTDMEYLMNHIVEPQTSKSSATTYLPISQPLSKPSCNRAKRLAKTKGMSREQWLQVRKQGIGSSDAAAACGLNPHMSMLELWMIKTGRMQNQPDQGQLPGDGRQDLAGQRRARRHGLLGRAHPRPQRADRHRRRGAERGDRGDQPEHGRHPPHGR